MFMLLFYHVHKGDICGTDVWFQVLGAWTVWCGTYVAVWCCLSLPYILRMYYKDGKCTVNEKLSVHTESVDVKHVITARQKQKCCFELLDCMLVVKSSAFMRAIMHSKQYGGRDISGNNQCNCTLQKVLQGWDQPLMRQLTWLLKCRCVYKNITV